MKKDINDLECISCPQQAQFCQGSEIQLKDGYWRESNLTDQIYACLLDSCSFSNPQSKNGCLTGFLGPLCNSCDNKSKVWGQQYGLKGQNCFPCNQQLNQIAFACFFIIFYNYEAKNFQINLIAGNKQLEFICK
ncbi:transmembrane protein (macronuclear) [Tetrahymena thermophila SB210]|uniref:Transmembrane protein n=1 Tax=Tetrahymena thermophila (strain SB210) TaxID=312017 RepID=Q23CR0_TETTS|nr:transmembrane protein [Tetrahymena thermophila SB210]EAR94315.2 transmembrane protein [Tetrahymena thermophila SB210]|eukprot:XP_001014560.2 transmembrane protein [Tetrahymena thermophila SB210]